MLTTFKKFTLNEKAIITALGRTPSELEWLIIKQFYYSTYLNKPIPVISHIFESGSDGKLQIGNKSLIVGLESKNSLGKMTAVQICATAGIKPVLKYKSEQSVISMGISDTPIIQNNHYSGTESLVFLQNGPKIRDICASIMQIESVNIMQVHPGSLGYSINRISNKNIGLDLDLNQQKKIECFSDLKIAGVLILIEKPFLSKVIRICKKANQPIYLKGQLKTTPSFILNIRTKPKVHLPFSIFNIPPPPQTSLNPVVNTSAKRDSIELKNDLSDYGEYMLKIWKHVHTKTWNNFTPASKADETFAYLGTSKKIAVTIPNNNHFLDSDAKVGSQLIISNAARQLVCRGYKPLAVSAIIHGGDVMNNDDVWKIQELFMGLQESGQFLKLNMVTPLITYSNKQKSQMEICVFGELFGQEMTSNFKHEDEFITMLGSHRGELNGSLYLKEILRKEDSSIPTVDLQMEARLQEVVLQGIQTGLIKSATNVSTGGMAAAFAHSLNTVNNSLGARIHLSRKLRQDEMLFGETQGLVIVTIGENDLMEFERICMSIGVPSTTIGRVTGDGKFSFNDVVSLDVKEMSNFQ